MCKMTHDSIRPKKKRTAMRDDQDLHAAWHITSAPHVMTSIPSILAIGKIWMKRLAGI